MFRCWTYSICSSVFMLVLTHNAIVVLSTKLWSCDHYKLYLKQTLQHFKPLTNPYFLITFFRQVFNLLWELLVCVWLGAVWGVFHAHAHVRVSMRMKNAVTEKNVTDRGGDRDQRSNGLQPMQCVLKCAVPVLKPHVFSTPGCLGWFLSASLLHKSDGS